MRAVLGRLGLTAPVAMAAVILGACGSTSSPTAAVVPAATATTEGEATGDVTSSVTVEGTVVDDSNRPMANVEVECMGDVVCTRIGAQVIEQDGPDVGLKTNAAGAYRMVVAQRGGTPRFLMNAAARGYEVTTREVAFPDSACSSDRADCTLTVNFTLKSQEQ